MDGITLNTILIEAFDWGNVGWGESTGLENVIGDCQVNPSPVQEPPNDPSDARNRFWARQ